MRAAVSAPDHTTFHEMRILRIPRRRRGRVGRNEPHGEVATAAAKTQKRGDGYDDAASFHPTLWAVHPRIGIDVKLGMNRKRQALYALLSDFPCHLESEDVRVCYVRLYEERKLWQLLRSPRPLDRA